MRTQRFLILPQMVASTMCLLGNSTRNIVPAKTAETTPSISIGCSLVFVFLILVFNSTGGHARRGRELCAHKIRESEARLSEPRFPKSNGINSARADRHR